MRRFFDKHLIVLSLLPVLAIMIMIFCFSAQNEKESNETSEGLTMFFVRLFHPEFDGLGESEQTALFRRAVRVVRKTAHFTEFGALGFFLLGHFAALAYKKGLRRPAPGAGGVGVLYAVSDELHQFFVGGRSPGLLDVAIDSAGVLCGLLVMALLLHLCRRGKTRN